MLPLVWLSINHIVSYAGKRICLLHDARWRHKISSRPLTIDYLYISKGYKGRIEELTTLFRIRTVILVLPFLIIVVTSLERIAPVWLFLIFL